MKLKIIEVKDFKNYKHYKEMFNGKIKKIFFKLVEFKGKIDGEFISFLGDTYLEQGFLMILENDKNKNISFEVYQMSNISKLHIGDTGLIIIYFDEDEQEIKSEVKNIKL